MEPLWDEAETARHIGKAISTLQKERIRGDGCPFVKIGRLVRYRPEDVRAYVASCVVRSTSEVV